ncbi:MAG: potassium transporter TrkA, partial [Lentisphaerae bacterium]
MLAIFSLFIILSITLLINRVATVALMHTGLSREAAQFQARSALSGVGFTTAESELVVNHPLRRRIVMTLMLAGNAGVVTAVASLLLAFVNVSERSILLLRIAVLTLALASFLMIASSSWLERRMARIISRALRRWTRLDVYDYASLLNLGGNHQIMEIAVEKEDWLCNKTLSQLALTEEGILVIALYRADGSFIGAPYGKTVIEEGDRLILYGTQQDIIE